MPSSRSMSYRSTSRASSIKNSSGKNSGQFYVILGLLLFIIIIGSILISAYMSRRELFTNAEEPKGKLIYLYMTTCGHCKEFSKTWDEITNTVNTNKDYKFTTEKYELDKDDKGKEYAEKNKINYAPAILFENSKGVVTIFGENERTQTKILEWAKTL
jgi:glutaredoxin